jgi:hypothetical protein
VSTRALVLVAAACGLAACGGGSSKPDDSAQAAKLRPLTARTSPPRVKPGPFATVAPALDAICADNAKRAARAINAGADPERVAFAASARLSRLAAAVPRPTDADARYTAWTDSLKTDVNLRRLAAAADGDKAKALREQADRTAAAGRKTAGRLGLRRCARSGG